MSVVGVSVVGVFVAGVAVEAPIAMFRSLRVVTFVLRAER